MAREGKANKLKHKDLTREQKNKQNDAQNMRRALRDPKNADVKQEFDKLTKKAKKDFYKKYEEFRNFDWIRSEKIKSEAHVQRSHRGYRWRTEQQIIAAEGYTIQNKDKKALANAKRLIADAQNSEGGHKVCCVTY